ncbi:hypothetical protein R3P38DRAFT_3194808 [Favolaschia claudopus]|uniref:Uncharacterized protein n=1 Tax=Favolaschia claudopus TaxID=2862362 RepID=A0AAW0BE30_9AGAR
MHHIFTQASSFRRAPNVMSRKDFHQHAWNRFQSQGLVDAETRPGVIGLTSEKKPLTLEAFKQAVILKHVGESDYPNSTQPAEPPGRVVHDSWSTVPHTLATRGQGTVRMLGLVDKAFDKCFEDSLLCPPESAFAGLPVELIIYIFHLFLDAFHPSGLSYRSGRGTLLLMDLFWRTFVVTPETTRQTIEHTLQVTGPRSLSVFVLDLRPQDDTQTANDRAVLLSSFGSILPTAFRWVELEIFSFSTLTMQALADHAIRQGIPALHRFALQSMPAIQSLCLCNYRLQFNPPTSITWFCTASISRSMAQSYPRIALNISIRHSFPARTKWQTTSRLVGLLKFLDIHRALSCRSLR